MRLRTVAGAASARLPGRCRAGALRRNLWSAMTVRVAARPGESPAAPATPAATPAPLAPGGSRLGTPAPAPAATRPAPRLAWVDAARGGAVVAVVLLHLSIGHFYQLPHDDRFVVPVWDRVNQIVGAVRMPLLFLVSGLLASGKIRRGFRGGRALEATAANAYLYTVWVGLYALLALLAGGHVPFAMTSWGHFASQFVRPETPLWFIFALAVYVPVFTAVRRVPTVVVVGATAALHLWASMLYTVESPLWTRALVYVVFFAVGARAPDLVRVVAASPAWTFVAALAAGLAFDALTLQALMSVERPDLHQAVLTMALFAAGAIAAIGLSALMCRVRAYRNVATWVGQRTLGIYILHIPLILVLDALLTGPAAGLATLARATLALDYAYPLLATAVIILACVGIETALTRAGAGFLFALPAPLRQLAERARMGL